MARARFAFLGRLVLLLAAGAANLTLPSIRAPLWTVEEMTRQSRSCDFSVDEMERFEDPADGVAKICESFASSPGWRQALPSEATVAASLASASRCAVVGRAPSLAGLGLGVRIDSFPVVIRTNRWVPAIDPVYNQSDFGSRSDIDILNQWALLGTNKKQYLEHRDGGCRVEHSTATEVANPASSSGYDRWLRCAQLEGSPRLLHPDVQRAAAALVRDATRRRNPSKVFPTHGFIAAVFALRTCGHVELFGFDEPRGRDAQNATRRGRTVYVDHTRVWSGHDVEAEHRIYARWAAPPLPAAECDESCSRARAWLARIPRRPSLGYGDSSSHGT